MKNLGMILLIGAILMMVLTGFSHMVIVKNADTGRLVDVKNNYLPASWASILGTGLFVAGILVLVLGKKS